MKRTIQVAIRRGEQKYIAECLEFPIVTQAASLDELVKNIEESVALFLKGEDLSELGLAERPVGLATLELEAVLNFSHAVRSGKNASVMQNVRPS